MEKKVDDFFLIKRINIGDWEYTIQFTIVQMSSAAEIVTIL